MRDSLKEWIAKLDSKLADESLQGDDRVYWLLARAQAEELRDYTPQRFTRFPERLQAGWGYLDEASLMASTELTKYRVLREKLARLAGQYQPDAIDQLVAAEESKYALPNVQAALAKFKKLPEGIRKQMKENEAAQLKESQDAYLAELKRRLTTAQDAGLDNDAGRYQRKLESLGSGSPDQ